MPYLFVLFIELSFSELSQAPETQVILVEIPMDVATEFVA